MKFLPTILSTATAAITYKDMLWNTREGKPLPQDPDRQDGIPSNFQPFDQCPDLPLNKLEMYRCDKEYCMAICPPGSKLIPTSENPKTKPKLRCKKDGTWNVGAPDCGSCDNDNFEAEPTITDSFLDMICHVNTQNMKSCTLTCKNGEAINGKRKETVSCFKSKNDKSKFIWATPKDKNQENGTDTEALSCPRNPITGPTTPPNDSCMTKDPTCTTLGNWAIKYMNNWTCRNCFRIQANYKFRQFNINDWEDKDYLEVYFRYKVHWISYGHPIERVEQVGTKGNKWRVYFKQGANFMSGMRWDANLRTLQKEWIKDDSIIRGVASCPCSNSVGSTPAPWK